MTAHAKVTEYAAIKYKQKYNKTIEQHKNFKTIFFLRFRIQLIGLSYPFYLLVNSLAEAQVVNPCLGNHHNNCY